MEETTSMTGDEDVIADDFKIQAADMPIHMQRAALHGAIQACRLYTTEKLIAESIKQDFDQMFTPTWHCIVGRNWGSCVTHSKQCYIRILYKDLTILLYKSTWEEMNRYTALTFPSFKIEQKRKTSFNWRQY